MFSLQEKSYSSIELQISLSLFGILTDYLYSYFLIQPSG